MGICKNMAWAIATVRGSSPLPDKRARTERVAEKNVDDSAVQSTVPCCAKTADVDCCEISMTPEWA
jgi:hypothetical protein